MENITQIIKDTPGVLVLQMSTDQQKPTDTSSVKYYDVSRKFSRLAEPHETRPKCQYPSSCSRFSTIKVIYGKECSRRMQLRENANVAHYCEQHLGDEIMATMVSTNICEFTLGAH